MTETLSKTVGPQPTNNHPARNSQNQSRSQGRSSVSRITLNFWLDTTLLVLFLVLCWSACVIRFTFPPGPSAAGWNLWGWNYNQWSDLHFSTLCAFALAVLLHIMLHWSWVCGVITSRFLRRRALPDGVRTIYGVIVLICSLTAMGLGLAAANLSVYSP